MATTTSVHNSAAPPQPGRLRGWGGGPGVRALITAPRGIEAARNAVQTAPGSGAIPRGMGRSYGDAAQLADGLVIDMTRMKGFQLEERLGTVRAQAGVTIGELLDVLVPAGWMLPVVPGTQHVTVGGAIASDIHGKSHGVDGTFGSHVRALGLLTADGEIHELGPESDLFAATLGGMGLTGVIVWARIALRRITSSLLGVDTDRAASLDDALALLAEPGGRYRVAWLDLLGSGSGRGVVTRARTEAPSVAPPGMCSARATVPARWPSGLLRESTVRAFNAFRYRTSPRRQRGAVERIGRHMFPLDALDAWPRLYGSAGLLQYQLVVPPHSVHVLHETIARLHRARIPCYLAVLKDFGPANDAPLSFPIEGWTLALDLPRAAPGLDAVLDDLDELVAAVGGRVYLSKDARIRPEAVRAMYPRLGEWLAVRDQADPGQLWQSDLAIRTGLVQRWR